MSNTKGGVNTDTHMGLSRRRTDGARPEEAGVNGGQRLEELLPPLAEGGAEGGEIEKVNAVALRQRWTMRELAGMQAEDPLLGRVQQLLKDGKERRPLCYCTDPRCDDSAAFEPILLSPEVIAKALQASPRGSAAGSTG